MTATTMQNPAATEAISDTREMLSDLTRISKNQLPMGRLLANTFLDGAQRTMDALKIREGEE